MVQQETLSSPVQLASEDIQAIVGLLTEHETCKTTGSLAPVFTLDRYASLVEYFMTHFTNTGHFLIYRQKQPAFPQRGERSAHCVWHGVPVGT